MKKKSEFYFSTRDLMMMAALAALGGVASTYINMIGDFFQSLLGFAGTTQWAAGLHVIWLMLASALIGKPGAASMTGIIKGFVEIFSGNTHGILVVIVDIVAGLVVDFVLLFSKEKKPAILFYLAAGFSSASNVIVFQVFASLPADILAFVAILTTSALAFVSGVLFGGVMTQSLVKALEKIGIIRRKKVVINKNKKVWVIVSIAAALFLTMTGGYYVYNSQTKVEEIIIAGDVSHAYDFPGSEFDFELTEREIESNGVSRKYQGVLIKELIEKSEPLEDGGVVLIEASDGYSFFVSMEEIQNNDNLMITSAESGNEAVYNVVGAESSKAWVRGISRIYVLPKDTIEISGNAAEPYIFAPQDWQDKMDSIYFSIDENKEKLQGVPLAVLVEAAQPEKTDFQVIINGNETSITVNADSIKDNNDIRLFTYPKENGFEFLLGQMDGTILLRHINEIEIN